MEGLRKLFCLIAACVLSACTQASFVIANIPAHFDDTVVHKDISYGTEPEQRLDIYLPNALNADARTLPVIIFFYGGRWETGSKDDYRFIGSTLANKGYLVVIPDYRKYPMIKFPVFVKDAASAIAWTADNVGKYGGSAKHLYLAGHSSGAHIAALAITDAHYLQEFGKNRSVIKRFVGLAGPYDFVPDEDDLKDMFGPPENNSRMQVTRFIDGKQPPMLLLWGADDKLVGKQNMDKLATAIRKKGGCVETKIYPDTDHVWLVGGLTWLGKSSITEDMMNFFSDQPCKSMNKIDHMVK